ncbi:MAG TPA: hypothetical protein VGS22_15220 [Thermoanaerobaculia bacterium]|nr:hypothetical protein [Thermoanaerobaculia bacterium]
MSSSNPTRRRAARANAFRSSFLDRLLARDDAESGGEDPERVGDWQVHEVAGRYVLLRDWERPGIDAEACWFFAREHALMAVAALSAAARGPLFSYGPETAEGTFPILLADGGALRNIGENRLFDSDFLESMQGLETTRRTPRSLAYLLEGASGPTIAIAGRILQRRVGRSPQRQKRRPTAAVDSGVAPDGEEP